MALVARLFKTGEAKLQQVKQRSIKQPVVHRKSQILGKQQAEVGKNCRSKLVNRTSKNNTGEVLSSSFSLILCVII
jgi:hypothetical protein